MKNIDKIRQMNSDELAEFMLNPCELCNECCIQHGIECKDGIKQWLEQEVEE